MVKLVIGDEVNCKFVDLDVKTRNELNKKFKFKLPYAHHLPAVRLGRWDGTVSFFDVAGRSFVKLLDQIVPMLVENGIEFDIEDSRASHEFEFPEVTADINAHIMWPEGHKLAGQPIILEDHQVLAINEFLKNPQSIQQLATGAGKTILTATICRIIDQKTLVIVPNKDLVTQTESDFQLLGLDVGVYYGDRKQLGNKFLITTWQSLSNIHKQRHEEVSKWAEVFLGLTAVIVDEAHSAKGPELKKLLCGPLSHVPIRWGMTGTVPKDNFDYYHLLVSIGPVINQVSSKELQDKGFLAGCSISIIQYQDIKQFRDYHEEHKWLTSDEERLNKIVPFIENVVKTGNTLLLVTNIGTGKHFQEAIKDSVFVSGAMASKKRKEHYTDVNTTDNMLVIATSGVAAVGLNIPRLFNIILFEPGKSFVRVIQSIGRGLRKAHDKDFATVYDITSSCKYSKKHLTKRKEYYREAGFPFTITKVD